MWYFGPQNMGRPALSNRKKCQLGVSERPSCARQADVIRLLLLTGCRKSKILILRWQDVDGNTINLDNAKTGPRRVFLNAPARAILERQPRSGSAYVFPAPTDPERPLSRDLPL